MTKITKDSDKQSSGLVVYEQVHITLD